MKFPLLTYFLSALFIRFCTTVSALFIPYAPCSNDTLKPCKSHPTLPSSILCQNIYDIKTFVNVLRCNRQKNMQEVFLEESSIDFLPLYILDFCGFSFLNVKTVVMSKLLEGDDMIRLQQLHLDNVTISTPWNWEPLAVLTRLIRFSVANMMIEILNGTLTNHLSENLQSLILTSTGTASIVDYAFQKFRQMIYISVQNNEIHTIRRTMFPRPSKIKYFYFGKNKITSLPENLFDDMPDLEVVDLQGNLISELHELTFKLVWSKLNHVSVEGNPLKCNCKMLWLTKKMTPAVFKGTCYAPKYRFGKQLKDLTPADFRCY